MDYSKLNESFDRRFRLCEKEDVVAYTKYTKHHEEMSPDNAPAFEVTKKGWEKQITGANKAQKLNSQAARGKIKDFFEKHPNADYAFVIIDNNKITVSAKKPVEEALEETLEDGEIPNFRPATIGEILDGEDAIQFDMDAFNEENPDLYPEDAVADDTIDDDLDDDEEPVAGGARADDRMEDPDYYYGDDLDDEDLDESVELDEFFGRSEKEQQNAQRLNTLKKKYKHDIKNREAAEDIVDHDVARDFYQAGVEDAQDAMRDTSKLGQLRHKAFGYSNKDVDRAKQAYRDRREDLDNQVTYTKLNNRYNEVKNTRNARYK